MSHHKSPFGSQILSSSLFESGLRSENCEDQRAEWNINEFGRKKGNIEIEEWGLDGRVIFMVCMQSFFVFVLPFILFWRGKKNRSWDQFDGLNENRQRKLKREIRENKSKWGRQRDIDTSVKFKENLLGEGHLGGNILLSRLSLSFSHLLNKK